MAGRGWCTHPERQQHSDVRILVRKAELACRNSWGSDLWVDAKAPADAPAAVNSTRQPSLPNPQTTHAVYDDEVTSVTVTPTRNSSPLNDDVISQDVVRGRSQWQDDDQDERIDLLSRDSRSAIQAARQRARSRHHPFEDDILEAQVAEPVEDDVVITSNVSHDDVSAIMPDDSGEKGDLFPPDDYLEEESPSRDHVEPDEDDDVIVSDGFSDVSPRSRRLRRAASGDNRPKERIQAKSDGADKDLLPPPSTTLDRDRFNSVPELSTDFELPLMNRRPAAPPRRTTSETVTLDASPEPDESTSDRAVRQAHSERVSARAEAQREQRRAAAPIASRESRRAANDRVTQQQPSRQSQSTSQAVVMPDLPDEADERRPAFRSTTRLSGGNHAPLGGVDSLTARSRPAATRQQNRSQSGSPIDPRRNWWRSSNQNQPSAAEADAMQPSPSPDEYDVVREDRKASTHDPIHSGGVIPEGQITVRPATAPEMVETQPDARQRAPIAVSRRPVNPRRSTVTDERDERRNHAQRTPVVEQPVERRTTRPTVTIAEEQAEPRVERQRQDSPRRRHTAPVRQQRDPAPLAARVSEGAQYIEDEPVRDHAFHPQSAVGYRELPYEEVREPVAHRPVTQRRYDTDDEPRIQPEMLLADLADHGAPTRAEERFDVRRLIDAPSDLSNMSLEDEDELLDMSIDIAPSVDRACGSCRHFRASDQEGRGWCTNNWAFSHRQMVNAGDLACKSTIGCWWLPADHETWLEDFEVSRAETPRIDRLIAYLNPEQPERKDVGRSG